MKIEFPHPIEMNIESKTKIINLNFEICTNVDCKCNRIKFILFDNLKTIFFYYDFETQNYVEDNYDESDIKIITFVLDYLKNNETVNLSFFKNKYDYVKEKLFMRQKTIENFRIGSYMNYNDIIWQDAKYNLQFLNKNYIMLDSYCVTPNCNCNEVFLNFYMENNDSKIIYPDFSFFYDYKNGTYSRNEGISNSDVEEFLNLLNKSVTNNFIKRHKKLKKEVRNDIELKMIKEKIVEQPKKRKLGRNEPCYCGSGIKYKKCCLDKDE